jgi:hypothetical protein
MKYAAKCRLPQCEVTVSDFLASILAKAAILLLESLITRIMHTIVFPALAGRERMA